jgi:hypothetical protein
VLVRVSGLIIELPFAVLPRYRRVSSVCSYCPRDASHGGVEAGQFSLVDGRAGLPDLEGSRSSSGTERPGANRTMAFNGSAMTRRVPK